MLVSENRKQIEKWDSSLQTFIIMFVYTVFVDILLIMKENLHLAAYCCVSGFITIDEILLIEISPNPTAMPSSYTIYKYSVNRKIRISEM